VRDDSVLARIALKFARSPEDVATESLSYILGCSPSAVSALTQLASQWTAPAGRPVVLIRSQAGEDDGARPDLELSDASGAPVILFENKFWAGLTENQPITYLERLRDAGGFLWFVAPAARLPFLWPTLKERTMSAGLGFDELLDASAAKVALVESGVALGLTSWTYLLDSVAAALEASGEMQLHADVRQIKGLCAAMESSGLAPFTLSDRTGPTGRLVVQFNALVDHVVRLVLMQDWASKDGLKASAGPNYYGHYLTIHGHGCQFVFHAQLWADHGVSPLWLRVAGHDWMFSEQAARSLESRLGRERCFSMLDRGMVGVWVPIPVPIGVEREAAAESVAAELTAVAACLEGLMPDESATVPPEAEG